MSFLSGLLTEYAPVEVESHNGFLADLRAAAPALAEAGLVFKRAEAATEIEATYVLLIARAGTVVQVGLTERDIRSLTVALISDIAEADLLALRLDWQAYLVADFLCRFALDALPEEMSMAPAEAVEDFASMALVSVVFSIEEEHWALPIRVMRHAKPLWFGAPAPARLLAFEGMPVIVKVCLPGLSLSFAELASIAPGDTLLVAQRSNEGLPCRLSFGGHQIAQGFLSGREITMTDVDFLEEETLDQALLDPALAEPPVVESALAHLSDVAIPLEFVLHAQTVPLKALTTLEEGQVLPLDTHPDLELRITSAGQTIGKGTLIAIGDHVGVQITEWPGLREAG